MTFSALLVLGWLGQAPVPVPATPDANPAATAEPSAPSTEAEAAPGPFKYEFLLGGKSEGIAPGISGSAVADKGGVEVTPGENALRVVLTGGVGANLYFGQTSTATQTIQLVQEFEITSSDPSVKEVVLTLESSLKGIIRSAHRANASVRLASATITPVGSSEAQLSISHPAYSVNGDQAYAYTEPLEPVKSSALPLGRYVIQANFTMTAEAGGLQKSHSTAIFAPTSDEIDPLAQSRDQFKEMSHRGFGFMLTLKADAPPGGPKVVHKLPPRRVTARAKATRAR